MSRRMNIIAIDTHCEFCEGGYVNRLGKEKGCFQVPTSIPALVEQIEKVPRPRKLVIEEGPLADWLSRSLSPCVEEMIVYWFQSGGRAYQDPYRGKLEQLVRALRTRHSEGALIRITAPMAGGEQEAHASVVAFMKAVVPALGPYFHD